MVNDGCVGEVRPRGAGERCEVLLDDGVLVPGLVDLQINGAFGIDFAVADRDDWAIVAGRLPGTGVTAVFVASEAA